MCGLDHAVHGHTYKPLEVPHLLVTTLPQRHDQPRLRVVVHRTALPGPANGARVGDLVEQPVDGTHIVPSVSHGLLSDDGRVAQCDRPTLCHGRTPQDCVPLLLDDVPIEQLDLQCFPLAVAFSSLQASKSTTCGSLVSNRDWSKCICFSLSATPVERQ